MPSSALKKSARMEFKTSLDLKDLLSEAASLSGQDLTAFVLGCAENRAREVVAQHQTLKLAKADQKRLFDLLSNLTLPSNSVSLNWTKDWLAAFVLPASFLRTASG